MNEHSMSGMRLRGGNRELLSWGHLLLLVGAKREGHDFYFTLLRRIAKRIVGIQKNARVGR